MSLYLLDNAIASFEYYIALSISLAILIYFLSPCIKNIFDPIITLILNTACSSALIIWLYSKNHIELRYLIAYVSCTTFMIFGMRLYDLRKKISTASRKSNQTPIIDCKSTSELSNDLNLNHLNNLNLLIIVINLSAILFSILSNSLAIFSDSPVTDRVVMSAANRWLSVIFFGCTPVGLAISFLLFIASKKIHKKIMYSLMIFIYLFAFISNGNKGAVLNAIMVLGTVLMYLNSRSYRIPSLIYRVVYSFIPVAIINFIYLASSASYQDGDWWYKLAFRLAGSGDNYIYFFVENQYETLKFQYNIVTYILHLVTSAFGLKLVEYNIGTAMYGASTGNYAGFGPNPGYVVEGMIFFGIYCAPIYGCLIGYLFSYSRLIFSQGKGNLNFILWTIFIYNSPSIPIDILYYFFCIISSLLIIYPIYILTYLATKKVELSVKSVE